MRSILAQCATTFLWIGAGLFAHELCAERLRIAAAAHFAEPIQIIATEFERDHHHEVTIKVASTSALYAMISAGEPFDLFLSADSETPARLVKDGQALGASLTYATGRLILWSATPGYLDEGELVLRSNRFKHIALADPERAPYGRAALRILKQLGLEDSLRSRFLLGKNVQEAFRLVERGDAEIGLVSRSQIFLRGRIRGSAWTLPDSLSPTLRHDAILLKASQKKRSAVEFMEYLKTSKVRGIIRSYGYELPESYPQ